MPYRVIKEKDKYLLKNIKTGKISNKKFNSKQTAINMAVVWMKYRKEKPIIKGNTILSKK